MVGKSLQQVEKALGARWALVISVVRDGQTLIPRGDTVIRTGDQVYVAGARGAVDRALAYVHTPSERFQNVMILGANTIGMELARDLSALGMNVKIIDADEEKCRIASERLHKVLILHGDGTDVDLLQSEGIDSMDGFVSVSKDEETNVLACLLAHHQASARPSASSTAPTTCPAASARRGRRGVSAPFHGRRHRPLVKRGGVVSTHSLGYSGSEILQFHLDAKCSCLGKPLAKLGFPRDAVIGAVLKKGHVVTPRGETVLHADDEVVVFALPEGVAAVEKFFS